MKTDDEKAETIQNYSSYYSHVLLAHYGLLWPTMAYYGPLYGRYSGPCGLPFGRLSGLQKLNPRVLYSLLYSWICPASSSFMAVLSAFPSAVITASPLAVTAGIPLQIPTLTNIRRQNIIDVNK